jgi:hypothetical protein
LAAREFFRGFYLGLLSGKTVQKSFEAGRFGALHDHEHVVKFEANTFRLCATRQQSKVAVDIEDGNCNLVVPKDPISNLPPLPEPFVGRDDMIRRVFSAVIVNRMVTLTGDKGSGKSSIVKAVGDHAIGRCCLDWIFFVCFDSIFRVQTTFQSLGEFCSQSIGLEFPEFPSCGTDEEFVGVCQSKRCLFIFDGVQTLQDGQDCSLDIQTFLNSLLKCPDVRVLVASTHSVKRIKDVAEKVPTLEIQIPSSPHAQFSRTSFVLDLRFSATHHAGFKALKDRKVEVFFLKIIDLRIQNS